MRTIKVVKGFFAFLLCISVYETNVLCAPKCKRVSSKQGEQAPSSLHRRDRAAAITVAVAVDTENIPYDDPVPVKKSKRPTRKRVFREEQDEQLPVQPRRSSRARKPVNYNYDSGAAEEVRAEATSPDQEEPWWEDDIVPSDGQPSPAISALSTNDDSRYTDLYGFLIGDSAVGLPGYRADDLTDPAFWGVLAKTPYPGSNDSDPLLDVSVVRK